MRKLLVFLFLIGFVFMLAVPSMAIPRRPILTEPDPGVEEDIL